MKLSEEEIGRICLKVLGVWKEKKLAETLQPEGQILSFMKATFIKDLQAEDELNKEVDIVLKKYEAQIDAGMDRRKLFNMIKNQLAKEKKIVL